ncbi:MMPL family transporter [Jongsikchunia kroppenstedtii]|uniref:MMPL family transporter n=1 Tax=Jongsikchunia kroppenstedtii TaxID=1121721 RepID=UPI00036DEFA7|nr:MMPL family transporter [Jongsikchunia kroppenstedtii]
MFGAIGSFVYRLRFAVIAVVVAVMLGLGLFGLDLQKHLSQSGWFDPGSQSSQGSVLADKEFGRDHTQDMLLLVTPPQGTSVADPAFGAKMESVINDLVAKFGPNGTEKANIVNRDNPGIYDPFAPGTAQTQVQQTLFNPDKTKAFLSIGIAGEDDDTVLANYRTIKPFFDDAATAHGLPEGTTIQQAGLQPVAAAMSDGMNEDIHRAEVIALPVVALMLFFIFGGVVAAVLPVVIGGLTIAGSLGILKLIAMSTQVNVFAQSVVTLIGLGIAIDYGLFIVSRFREEIADGYDTRTAVRRTVMTAGQTVVFSATIIVAALACLLIFPQGFLKSVSYGAICAVSLAALCSITVLPAILSILGPRIDMWGLKILRRTKTREEIENGFWGRLAGWVMRHPLKTAIPVILVLLALIIPFAGIKFGGLSEKYLPPDNPYRAAQQDFDKSFPAQRTNSITLVIRYDANSAANLQQVVDEASNVGMNDRGGKIFTKDFTAVASGSGDTSFKSSTDCSDVCYIKTSAPLASDADQAYAVKQLRKIDTQGTQMWVTGTPALTQDSIDTLMGDLPLMVVLLLLVVGLLMFLAFGSLILPIKAALVSALGLGATLGILTWIFVDGHGSSIGNFTPQPLMSAVLVLIISIIFGLSMDYEVFLLSRMVEARQRGATTSEAIRKGTAHTGRIITAAAAILVVVTGAFGLSEIVMMKYISYGIIAALILDATIIRMLLVPAVMKLLGDDCWWAPAWMKRVQEKIGLGENILDDEPRSGRPHIATASGPQRAGVVIAEAPTRAMQTPRRSDARPGSGPRPAAGRPSTPPTSGPTPRPSAPPTPRPSTPPTSGPTPTPRPSTPPASGPQRRTPADGHRGRVRMPGRGVPPTPTPRPGTDENDPNRPKTGGWRLGASGIRLGDELSGPTGASRPSAGPDETSAPNSGPRPTAPRPEPRRTPPPAPQAPAPQPSAGQSSRPSQPPQQQQPTQPPGASTTGRAPLRRRPDLGEPLRGGGRPDSGDQPLVASPNPNPDLSEHPAGARDQGLLGRSGDLGGSLTGGALTGASPNIDVNQFPRLDESAPTPVQDAPDDTDDDDSGGRRRARGDGDQLSVRDLMRRRGPHQD